MHAELYRRYAPALIRKAERVLGNSGDAEDLVHGLFVDLMQGAFTKTDFPYLFRATTHRCLNVLRDGRRRGELLAHYEPELRGAVRTHLDERVINLDLLLKLMGTLDDHVAEVVVCHCYDDLPQEEVAELTGLSRRTVGKYLDKAKQALLRVSQEDPS